MSERILHREATYDDLLKAPDHLVAEIVEGELFMSPRPAPRHAEATGSLYSQLRRRYHEGHDGPGEWWIVFEPELHLGRDILVPDIAAWRRERLPTLPNTAYFDLAPDWVCETVSVATARLDRLRKLPRYARHAVEWAWIVDPVARGIEVYRRQGEHMLQFATYDGAKKIRPEPFTAADLDLGALWID
jgi:Uma2 family endonuclease